MANSSEKDNRTRKLGYTNLGIDIRFVHALWHISRVSHLAEKELENVCGTFGLSSADTNVLGAIWNTESGKLRATDLAEILRVSNAVLSPRIKKLEGKGLLIKRPIDTDRRAAEISLTELGAKTIESTVKAIAADTEFSRHFQALSEQEQIHFLETLNKLHNKMLRDFSSRSRGK